MGNEPSVPEPPLSPSSSRSTQYRSGLHTPSPGYTQATATPRSHASVPAEFDGANDDPLVTPVTATGSKSLVHTPQPLSRIPVASKSDNLIDPVVRAAAVGAAAKKAKDYRLRRQRTPDTPSFLRIEVDNEWKASLQRFAKTAASTARTVRSVAAPVLAEAAEAYQHVSSSAQKQPKPVKYNNPDTRSEGTAQRLDSQLVVTSGRDLEIQAAHADGILDQIAKGENLIATQLTEQLLNENSEKHELHPNLTTLRNELHLHSIHDAGQSVNDLSNSFASSIPIRKQQFAPSVTSPAAFGGGYGSAYSGANRRESGNSTPGLHSPLSNDEMLDDATDQYANSRLSRHRKTHSDISSDASSHTGDDFAWRQINLTDRQQQLLATPKQFVELVSKRLTEERPKAGANRSRVRRRRNNLVTSTAAPFGTSQKWLRHVDGNLFDRPLDERSPSLSPPGSPISAAMYVDIVDKQLRERPIVTLWDMIPSKPDLPDSTPELVSEKGVETPVIPGPMLKQSFVFDLPPGEFLGTSRPVNPSTESQDYEMPLGGENGAEKRKTEQDDNRECSSLLSGSTSSAGSIKRNRVDRRKHYRRRRSMIQLDKKSGHSRTPPGRSQKHELSPKRFTRSLSPDIDSTMRKRRLFELDASGLFAEAGIDSQSAQFLEDDGMLNEALLTFLTMSNLSLTNAFPKIELPDELEYVASIRWRQLLANWKHQEMIEAMTKRHSSLHFSDRSVYTVDPSARWSSSASTTSVDYFIRKREDVVYNQVVLAPLTLNLSGMAPSYPFELQSLSRFITHVGSRSIDFSNNVTAVTEIKHVLDGEVTVERLLHLAGEKHGKFSRLINQLAVFASQDYNPSQMDGYERPDNVVFSVDIKDAIAIHHKAATKYAGNLLEVKDVLRAQVVFPTEGSLVCAFTFLNQYCTLSTSHESSSKIVEQIGVKSEIVRIKNLFAVTTNGEPCCVNLPTGYRHLLLNIRLDNSVLAGKFQGSRLFRTLIL